MVARIRTLLETRQLTPTQFADVIGVARPIVSHILSGRNKPSLEVVQRILAAMPDLSMPWLLNGTGPMQASVSIGATPAVGEAPAKALAAVISSAPAAAVPVSQASETEERAHYKRNSLLNSNLGDSASAPLAAFVPVPAPFSAAAMLAAAPKARPVPRRFAPPPKQDPAPGQVPAPALASVSVVSAPILVVPVPADVPVGDVVPPKAIAAGPEVPARELAAAPPRAPTPSDATAAALFAGSEKPIRRIVIFYRDGSFADYQPE